MSAPFVVEMVVAAGLLFGIPDAGTVRTDPAALAAEDAEHAVEDGQATEAWEPTAVQKAAMFFGIPDTETDDINDPGHWAQIWHIAAVQGCPLLRRLLAGKAEMLQTRPIAAPGPKRTRQAL